MERAEEVMAAAERVGQVVSERGQNALLKHS
jgi:hypothetical protein